MQNAQQTWTDSIIVHLDLLNQLANKLPANERLEPAQLDKILELTNLFKSVLLVQTELHGFKIK